MHAAARMETTAAARGLPAIGRAGGEWRASGAHELLAAALVQPAQLRGVLGVQPVADWHRAGGRVLARLVEHDPLRACRRCRRLGGSAWLGLARVKQRIARRAAYSCCQFAWGRRPAALRRRPQAPVRNCRGRVEGFSRRASERARRHWSAAVARYGAGASRVNRVLLGAVRLSPRGLGPRWRSAAHARTHTRTHTTHTHTHTHRTRLARMQARGGPSVCLARRESHSSRRHRSHAARRPSAPACARAGRSTPTMGSTASDSRGAWAAAAKGVDSRTRLRHSRHRAFRVPAQMGQR